MNQKKKRNFWNKLGTFIFVFAFVWFFYEADDKGDASKDLPVGEVLAGLCTKVVDGDTIDVKVAGRSQRIRILGIDCMETHNKEKQAQQARRLNLSVAEVRRLGQQATAQAKKQLLGKEVQLPRSGNKPEYGGYDRLLCYVEVDGRDFGMGLLNEGLAETRREPHARSFQYSKASGLAKQASLGVYQGR